MPPRQILPPADDTASRALVNAQTAVTRVKELISEGVAHGWTDGEMTKRLNAVIAAECRKIGNAGLREETRKSLVTAARKWHYELKMTYRVLDENLRREAQRQPLGIDIDDLLRKTPYEKEIEFRRVLDDGGNVGIPVIRDYQRSVKLAIKAMSAEPPKIVSGTGRAMPLRLRAEMAVRYSAAVESLQELINAGVKLCWISSHASCSPRCASYQGQLYSLDGTSGTADGIPYRSIQDALAGPKGDGNGCISGYNCRHRVIAYEVGSRPPADYSEAEMKREYAIDQQQRKFENQIRQLKTEERQLRAAGMTKEAAALRRKWRRLTVDYQIYSMEHDRAYYPYRCVIDSAETAVPEKPVFVVSEFDPSEMVDISVKWSIINNKPYFDRLRAVAGKKTIGKSVARVTLEALRHRDGTKGEDLYLIDARSGIVVSKNVDSTTELGVEKTPRMKRLLTEDDDRSFILFHNHPMSSPPSIVDLNSLFQHPKISFGIVVGHDGTIYKYTAPNQEIPSNALDIAIFHYENMGYSHITARQKAYERLRKQYGFSMEVIPNDE